MQRPAFALLILFSCVQAFAQVTQTVKGRVVDKVTGGGLPGAIVQLKGSTSVAVSTSENGDYKLKEVPVGRQTFVFFYTGYRPVTMSDIIVTSGKEMVLNVELEESAMLMDEVEVKASSDTDVVNTMQAVNMKSFSIEETERYPGARQDPARMAQNFAGVQGTNDSRNDIVIRGNSPAGLLWRLEDIDIPNPNHFAVAGSAGGPQSIINNKYLANSEFFTGAFPANYGNALGGVFDLRMRNGNTEKHERTFQLGALGTELALEGPVSRKSGASYLLSYRYSTLALFGSVNVNLGTSAIPYYQDLGLRLNFPTRKAGVFSFTGIGGLSDINIILSNIHERPKELYGDQNRDQMFRSAMGTGILSHVYSLGPRTVMKTSLAYSGQQVSSDHFLVLRNRDFVPNDTLPRILGYYFIENKATLAWYVKHKVNARNSFKAGFFANHFDVVFTDSIKFNSLYDTVAAWIQNKPFKKRMSVGERYMLIQPYVTYVHKFNDDLSINTGLFAQYLTLNGRYSVEPRASLRWQPARRHVLGLAYGMHSQMQSTYLYFTRPDSIVKNGAVVANTEKALTNKDLDFSKAHHAVLGYDYLAGRYLKFKTELYYQYLWSVPVYVVPSGVSAINRGAIFNRFFPVYTMTNTGTGYNYGIEFTVEKLYHRHYFLMFSGSLFESKYTASNGRTFDTDFNGNYMMNLLTGLEFSLGKGGKDILSVGTKFTYGGGKRYSPVDRAASDAIMDVVPQDDKINTLQFPAYNRLDLRVSYKINGKHVGTEIALDLLNVLNARNVLALSYSPDPADLSKDPWVRNYQLGFLPLFYVKVDF
jgi:hypothetical protein